MAPRRRAQRRKSSVCVLYAVLDHSRLIAADQLAAALALWDYCERSARHVYGDSLGDDLADDLLGELRSHPDGMTRTEIRQAVHWRTTGATVTRALKALAAAGLAEQLDSAATGGRRAERWHATREQSSHANADETVIKGDERGFDHHFSPSQPGPAANGRSAEQVERDVERELAAWLEENAQ